MSKPPPKHTAHGNYQRADYFEAECVRLLQEKIALIAQLAESQRIIALDTVTVNSLEAELANRDRQLTESVDHECAYSRRIAALEGQLREFHELNPQDTL
jgi:hypothetical protein